MKFLFRGDAPPPSRSHFFPFITPCVDLIRLWFRGPSLPHPVEYGDRFSRFQPVMAPLRAHPQRRKRAPRW